MNLRSSGSARIPRSAPASRPFFAHVQNDLDARQVHAQIARQIAGSLPAVPDLHRYRGACCRRCGWASAVLRARKAAASADGSRYCSATDEIMYAAFDFFASWSTSTFAHRSFARIFRMQLSPVRAAVPSCARPAPTGASIIHLHDLVAPLVLPRVQNAALAQPELLFVLRALRNLQQRAAIDGGHFDLGAQARLRRTVPAP